MPTTEAKPQTEPAEPAKKKNPISLPGQFNHHRWPPLLQILLPRQPAVRCYLVTVRRAVRDFYYVRDLTGSVSRGIGAAPKRGQNSIQSTFVFHKLCTNCVCFPVAADISSNINSPIRGEICGRKCFRLDPLNGCRKGRQKLVHIYKILSTLSAVVRRHVKERESIFYFFTLKNKPTCRLASANQLIEGACGQTRTVISSD